eukprot:scaffold2767_cov177-Amphora_coffeaeformis.AAC.7
MISATVSYQTCLRMFVFITIGATVVGQVPTSTPTTNTTTTDAPTMSPLVVDTTTPTVEPSAPPFDNSSLSIYQIGLTNGLIVADLASLASLQTILDDPAQTLTLFAPVNEAFAEIHPTIVEYLQEPENILLLRQYLLGHVAAGDISAAILRDSQNITFESSQTSPIAVDANDDIFIGSTTKILTADIIASNGRIHLIDGILGIPTLPQFLSTFGPALLQALQTAGLLDQLDGNTLFGPSLFAFVGLSESFPQLTNAVLTDIAFVSHLTEIFLAHTVPDIMFGDDFEDGQNITMVNGDNFTLSMINGTISLSPGTNNGIATVQANVITVQTILYQVDGLLRASFLDTTLVDVAVEYTSTFSMLLAMTELEDVVANTFNLTVFAPTNEAFSAVNPVTSNLLQTPAGVFTLNAILSYHIAPGTYNSAFLLSSGISSIASLYAEGAAIITVSSDDGAVLFNGDTGVVRADVVSNNGILHVINKVMSLPVIAGPPSVETDPPSPTPTTPPVSASSVFGPSLWTGWLGWLVTTLMVIAR